MNFITVLITVFTFFLFYLEKGKEKCIECAIFEASVNDEIFKREFFVCTNTSRTIMVHDKCNGIVKCRSQEVCSKIVRLVDKKADNELDPATILLYRVDKTVHSMNMYFTRPYSGAAVMLQFDFSSGKIVKEKHLIGSF